LNLFRRSYYFFNCD